ncbi:MAG: TonB-dependent receptor plug domain-containing protein [Bacteroidetes bacterium]|nr:TonB-dependent receptor plug domain-containing protein [Bacteroidota bacterium]
MKNVFILVISLLFINICRGQITTRKGEIWNVIGRELGAWDLKNDKARSIFDTVTDKDMINPEFMGGKHYFKKNWKSGNATTFVPVAKGFYDTVTYSSVIKYTFENGIEQSSVGNVAVNDVYIANLRGSGEFALIKITNIILTTTDNYDKIEFEYKKNFITVKQPDKQDTQPVIVREKDIIEVSTDSTEPVGIIEPEIKDTVAEITPIETIKPDIADTVTEIIPKDTVRPVIADTVVAATPSDTVRHEITDTIAAVVPADTVKQAPSDSADENLISVPVTIISASDLENDEESQDISGLLSSSSDVFVSTAGFTFGPARFRIRGYDSENTNVHINGTPVNDMESGGAYWSTWGGLNDATRNKEVVNGLNPAQFSFGGVGGATNIITRASEYRKGIKATYSIGNRSYRNRVMLTASTGKMENGLAVTFSGSRRWAQEGYVEGTFYDAWSYFLAAEKEIGENQSLNFTFFGAPTKRGKQGMATQEAYDLAGTNYYNPYWGYQDGVKRNSRISNYHSPMMLMNHYWKPDEKTNLVSGLSYSFGRGGSTALNWYRAKDPRPDYYRYFPSYYLLRGDTSQYDYLTQLWTEDENTRQVNWDHLYFANSDEYYTVQNEDGSGSDVTGKRAKYIVEERRNDHSRITANSILNKSLNERVALTGGLNLDWYKGFHFKEIYDLLGADYWLDVDQFAERDFADSVYAQSDLNHPDNTVVEGERFGYDYTSNINKYELFAQGKFTYSKFDFHLSALGSYTQFWRTGNMRNGKFPDNSYGDSEKQNFFNYGVKGGAIYKITGRHLVEANGAYLTRAPFFRDAYLSPRTRDNLIEGLTSEKIMAGDAGYHFRSPYLKARLTGYYTEFRDQVKIISYYDEDLRTFINCAINDIDMVHIGTELGVEAKISQTVSLSAVGAKGDYLYNSRPTLTIAQDNSSEILVSEQTAYLKNYRMGSTPQTAASLGMKYRSPRYWTAGFNVNYFDDTYIDLAANRRTEAAVSGIYLEEEHAWKPIIEQEKLPSAYTIDIYAFKSFKIKKYFIFVNAGINNILGRKDIITGGYEQLRFDSDIPQRFPSRYSYMYGRTFFVNVSFSF